MSQSQHKGSICIRPDGNPLWLKPVSHIVTERTNIDEFDARIMASRHFGMQRMFTNTARGHLAIFMRQTTEGNK